MANQGQADGGDLGRLSEAMRDASAKGPPPVHLWNPPFCGDIDMRIGIDGAWYYMGTPIGRPALVRLFASVLKREDGRYFLVTPVEKCGIRVDDAPFMAVEMTSEGADEARVLRFRTNVDDWVTCDAEHGLRFVAAPDGGLTPYLHVRRDLWAKVTRALYYDLVELACERVVDGVPMVGVMSGGSFFAMAPASEVRRAT